MTRYYCDYCDTYLTHDSPSVRKQHNSGYKHKANVRTYYQQFEEQQTQSLIDQRIKEHLGQAAVAAYQQVGAPFNQHIMSVPGLVQRPRLPVPLPPPGLPIGVPPQAALLPGMRPPVLMPPPVGVSPGYGTASLPTASNAVMPPGAPPTQLLMNNITRPPALEPPISGALPTATSNGSAPFTNPLMYQTNQISAPSVSSAPVSESN